MNPFPPERHRRSETGLSLQEKVFLIVLQRIIETFREKLSAGEDADVVDVKLSPGMFSVMGYSVHNGAFLKRLKDGLAPLLAATRNISDPNLSLATVESVGDPKLVVSIIGAERSRIQRSMQRPSPPALPETVNF